MIFEYRTPWGGEVEQVELFKRCYSYNGRLAVLAETLRGEPFANFTVCLPYEKLSSEDESLAFVDINNNPGVDKWLEENKVAEPTGKLGDSGYCTYPEYRFNLNMLEE